MGFGSCFPKNPLKKRHITIFLFWSWGPHPPPNLNFVKIRGFRERSKWIMLQGESSDWVRSFCIVSIMYRGYRKKLLEPLEHVLNMSNRVTLTFVTDFAEMVYAPNQGSFFTPQAGGNCFFIYPPLPSDMGGNRNIYPPHPSDMGGK